MTAPITSLESFLAWVETKDPVEIYDYGEITSCAGTQYLKHMGLPCNSICASGDEDFYIESNPTRNMVPLKGAGRLVKLAGKACDYYTQDYTFGTLAEEIRKEMEFEKARAS